MTDFAQLEHEVELKSASLTEMMTAKEERRLKAVDRYKRSFDAAKFSNLNSQWSVVDFSPSMELYNDLQQLRVRSRNLYCNTPVVSNFVALLQQNVVGHQGFTFKSKVLNTKGMASKASKLIENAWADYCKAENFSVDGQLSLNDTLDLACQSLGVDGEVLVKKVYGRGKYAVQVQLLHAEQLIITRHEDYEMGIKRDEYGKPVEYCVTKRHPSDGFIQYMYEPADRIIHAFIPYQIGAPRGVPMIAAAMPAIKRLQDYEEAELIAARIEASKHLVYTQTQPDDLDSEVAMETVLPAGPKRNTIAPGMAEVLPPGVNAQFTKPEHPNTAYESYTKSCKKSIASGIGLSYNTLYSDFEATSFSSMRAAFITERAFYRKIQDLFVNKILRPVFENWIDVACAAGVLDLPPVMGNYDFYKTGEFTGKAYEFSNPLQEHEAQKILLEERLMSRTQICAERGVAYSDVLADIKAEQELEVEMGINFELLPRGTVVQAVPAGLKVEPSVTESIQPDVQPADKPTETKPV